VSVVADSPWTDSFIRTISLKTAHGIETLDSLVEVPRFHCLILTPPFEFPDRGAVEMRVTSA
jgi:hypothetical protein